MNSKYIRSLLYLSIMLLLSADSSICALELSITPYKQQANNSCWAACSKMILDSYQYSTATELTMRCWHDPNSNVQCSNVADLINTLSGEAKSTNIVIIRYSGHNGTTYNIQNTFTPYNKATGGGNLSQGDVVKEINAGRPFIIGWLYGDGHGHNVLATGYTNSDGTVGSVVYNNPFTGLRETEPFANVVKIGDTRLWFETLRMTTNPKFPIPTGMYDYVTIQNGGSFAISQGSPSINYQAVFTNKTTMPPQTIVWTWKLVLPSVTGDIAAATQTFSTTGDLKYVSNWNIANFTLPIGNSWIYDFDGNIPGRVELDAYDGTEPHHFDFRNVQYTPLNGYPGYIAYHNKNISTIQSEVKAHQGIGIQNDQFQSGANVTLKAGGFINVGEGVTINSGSAVNLTIDPSVW